MSISVSIAYAPPEGARHIRDFASRYRKRYLEHLQQRHRAFDVKGLSTQGIYSLQIEQVYVELTIDPKQAADVSPPIPKRGRWRSP